MLIVFFQCHIILFIEEVIRKYKNLYYICYIFCVIEIYKHGGLLGLL